MLRYVNVKSFNLPFKTFAKTFWKKSPRMAKCCYQNQEKIGQSDEVSLKLVSYKKMRS